MVLHRKVPSLALSLLLVWWATSVVETVFAGNPYQRIVERNVFRLRPAPPARPEPDQRPRPKVHLTGITTILRGKRALLKVEFPAKPPERAKEESYILTEGQRVGRIQVLEINEKLAQVKVDNSGTITNLSFEKIGPTPAPVQTALPSPQPFPRWRGLPYRTTYR